MISLKWYYKDKWLLQKCALDSQPQVISIPVACPWSVVFSGYSGFLHHLNWSPWYSWNIVESGVKTPKLKINQSVGSENWFELVNFLGFAFRLWIFPLWSCTEYRHINLLISSAWSWKKRKSKSKPWILVMGINLFWLHLTSVDNCKIHNQNSITWISPPDWGI
jgi:hypothetical protein